MATLCGDFCRLWLETWCLSRGTAAADVASMDASLHSSSYLTSSVLVVKLKMICYFSVDRVNWGFGLSIAETLAVGLVDTAHPLYGFSGSSWQTTRRSDFMESRHCELCQWNFADTYKQTGFRVDRSYLAASVSWRHCTAVKKKVNCHLKTLAQHLNSHILISISVLCNG